jgi:RNA polymerase sigma-70 factor (ECF subfamily)
MSLYVVMVSSGGLGEQFGTVLDAAGVGADWAWEILYDELSPVVYGYFRSRGVIDPDDLVGETFLHVVRNVSTFEGDERSFRAWVIGIAHRRFVDSLRRKERRPLVPVAGFDPEPADDTRSPEEVAITRAEYERVMSIVRTLTPDQQDVLLLRLVADLRVEEVAELLGKRVTSVKALQRRALAAVDRRISRTGVSPR